MRWATRASHLQFRAGGSNVALQPLGGHATLRGGAPASFNGGGRPRIMRTLAYVEALRPHQWLKNTLVFTPMAMAHRGDADALVPSLLVFAAFCLVASAGYVFNDLRDIEADRTHPTKRLRPFAAGTIPERRGRILIPALAGGGLALAGSLGPGTFAVLLLYFGVTLAYSLGLKRRVVLDICILAGLYSLRVVAGGVATGIPLSVWLLAFSTFLFLSLAAVKRQAELVAGGAVGGDPVRGRGYGAGDLPLVATMGMSSGYVAVLVMALYLNSPEVLELYRAPYGLWGVCLVLLYWVPRMVFAAHRGYMHHDPIIYAVTDPVSRLCGVLVLLFGVGAALW